MKERQKPDWFDFSVMALSPVLIMGLVGSLAFFLLDILYGGKYVERLTWTLFFFVVGAVLVARIAIVVDPQRSKLYGFALGGAVFLAMTKFVDHLPGSSVAAFGWLIHLAIIGVVLWASNRLVWNCTFLDEHDPDPGRGLLNQLANPGREPGGEAPANADPHSRAYARGSPGLSVIYFTLAAFPLFGLGQSLIPIDDVARRRYAFLLMSVYVASGLGLLLTTTLLGLRRYLRQRRLTMPSRMTAMWVGIGGALIALMLIVGAFFPRPHAEYPLFSLTRIGSQDREASRIGQGDAAGKGQGRGGAKGDGDSQEGAGQGQEGGKAAGKSGKSEGGAGGDKGSGAKSGQKGDKSDGGSQGKNGDGDDRTSSNATSAVDAIANTVKWILLLVIGIPLLFLVALFLLRNAAFLPAWLQKWLDAIAAWWQSLFGRQIQTETKIETAEIVRPPRPFRSFRNPFADGTAARRTTDDLVRYSFAALEAWANERDLSRTDPETPREFVDRLGRTKPEIGDASHDLATHYANLAYGRRRVPNSAREQLERLWSQFDWEPAAQAKE